MTLMPFHNATLYQSIYKNRSNDLYYNYAMEAGNRIAVATSGMLSMAGTVLIIITYVAWKDVRTSSRRILVYLSIADFLVAAGNLLGLFSSYDCSREMDALCRAQSFITSTFSIVSFFWSTALAIYLHITLVCNRSDRAERLMPYFHFFCWTVGPCINIAALTHDKLGYSADAMTAGWCWIKYKGEKAELVFWMLIDGKLEELVAYIIVLGTYVHIKMRIRKGLRKGSVSDRVNRGFTRGVIKAAKAADTKLALIPLLFILTRMWGTIRFFMYIYRDIDKAVSKIYTYEKVFLTLQGIGDSAQGWVNCILFCFLTPKIREHLRDYFLRCWMRCCYSKLPSPLKMDRKVFLTPNVSDKDEKTPLLHNYESI